MGWACQRMNLTAGVQRFSIMEYPARPVDELDFEPEKSEIIACTAMLNGSGLVSCWPLQIICYRIQVHLKPLVFVPKKRSAAFH